MYTAEHMRPLMGLCVYYIFNEEAKSKHCRYGFEYINHLHHLNNHVIVDISL